MEYESSIILKWIPNLKWIYPINSPTASNLYKTKASLHIP